MRDSLIRVILKMIFYFRQTNQSWGLRLVGGHDVGTLLKVEKVKLFAKIFHPIPIIIKLFHCNRLRIIHVASLVRIMIIYNFKLLKLEMSNKLFDGSQDCFRASILFSKPGWSVYYSWRLRTLILGSWSGESSQHRGSEGGRCPGQCPEHPGHPDEALRGGGVDQVSGRGHHESDSGAR